MSNEIRVVSSLQIRKGNLNYQGQPTSFNANMAGLKGPTPGSITAGLAGTDVDLTEIQVPGGLCRIQNVDPVNWIEIGMYDPITFKFYPMLELLPGESYIVRLSRKIGDLQGTGTGSGVTGGTDTLRVKANAAPCDVLIESFDA